MLGPLDREVNPGSDFLVQVDSCGDRLPKHWPSGRVGPGPDDRRRQPFWLDGKAWCGPHGARHRSGDLEGSWGGQLGARDRARLAPCEAGQRRPVSGRRCPFRALTEPPVEEGRAAGWADQARSVPSGSVTTTRTLALGAEGRQKLLGSTRSTATRKIQVRLPGFMCRLDPRLRPVRDRLPHPCTPTRPAARGAFGRTASVRGDVLRRA